MDVDVDGFASPLAARLAAIVPDGFHVELAGDMLWFRCTEYEGRYGDTHNDTDNAVLACEPISLAGPGGA
jgi:hypothetical protein